MRLSARVGGLRDLLAAEVRAGERAATQTIRGETEALKQDLRRQVQAAFGSRSRGIAFAWRARVFPSSGVSLRPAGLVWTKVPAIIQGFDEGALIRPRGGGRYLAIPTGFNAPLGRRGRGMRVTPAQMVASRVAFLRPFKSGRGFVWCLPVYEARGLLRGRRGQGRLQVIAGGIAEVATGNRRGRNAWAKGLLDQGLVPMFLLLPSVKLPKRLDVAGAALAAAFGASASFLIPYGYQTTSLPSPPTTTG